MALKHGSKSETRRKKTASVDPDFPFTGGGVVNSPEVRPGPKTPAGRKKGTTSDSPPSRMKMPAPERVGGRQRSMELETTGHARRREGTRNPKSPHKPTPMSARRSGGK